MKFIIANLFLLLSLVLFLTNAAAPSDKVQKTINDLLDLTIKSQIQTDETFKFMDTWSQQKGLFPSDIKLNFVGNEVKTELRRLFAIPDSNMFVTNFVVFTLLQSEKLGIIKNNVTMINLAVEAILSYQNKNSDPDSGVYTFWPQVYNESLGTYTEYPVNLISLVDEYGSFERAAVALADFLKKYDIAVDLEKFGIALNSLKVAFRIPPDSDDTGCNLALGYVIEQLSTQYPEISKLWQSINPNVSKTIDTYLKYAYRPFSNDSNSNSIDPRTYYAIHPFLESWTTLGRDPVDLVLPGTWLMDISEESQYFPYLQMPFNENNVDLSVAINTLFGLSSAIIQNGPSILTEDVERLITSITYLIEWGINSELIYKRPDIALLYYPSIYDFTWFVSRVLVLLESEYQLDPQSLPPVLNNTLNTLRTLMLNNGTDQILSRMVDNGRGGFYWDDFLGDADELFGKPIQYGEDRFFSSALALNVLIDSWTIPNQAGQLIWRDNTPDSILAVIDGGIIHLTNNILVHSTQTYNAFFSGSMKSLTTFPFYYPMNVCKYINGSVCDPNYNTDEIIGAVSGVIPHDQYQEMLQMKWFNSSVPVNWTSYNTDAFPYWSSQPLTYSISILALSKSLLLGESNN